MNNNNTNTYMKENKIIKEISSGGVKVNMNKIGYHKCHSNHPEL